MDAEFLRHQFEDGHDGVVVKNKLKPGVRHLQLVYMFCCAVSFGAVRGATPVALLALTDRTRLNDTYIQIYSWDRRIQGGILSSFLFGYALSLFPAELVQRGVGGKHSLTGALLASGALLVAMPTIVTKGGWVAVCNAFLWLGMSQACLAPANQLLLTKFLPPSERGIFSIIVHSGTTLGVIIGMPVSGILSQTRLGWELIFYSQAMLVLSMACLWTLLTASTPQQHQAMGDAEKEFIRESLSSYKKKVLKVQWRSILESRPFWAATVAHAASNMVYVFFLFHVPDFLLTFGTNIKTVSWQATLPFVALWLMRVTTAPTIDWLCRLLQVSFKIKLTYLRKFINAIGACGVILGLTLVSNLAPVWHRTAIALLICTLGTLGFQMSGFLETHKDMSENYPGTMLSLSRAVASVVGALMPIIVGTILNDHENELKRWRAVFLSLASLYVICNVVFSAGGSSERQFWDRCADTGPYKFGYHNALYDTNQLELEELKQKKLIAQEDDDAANNTTIFI